MRGKSLKRWNVFFNELNINEREENLLLNASHYKSFHFSDDAFVLIQLKRDFSHEHLN